MHEPTAPSWIEGLDLAGVGPPDFFGSLDEVARHAPLQQAHILRQAWTQLDLCGILCTAGKPVAYIADAEDGDFGRIRKLHQGVWSQGVVPLLIVVTPTRVFAFSGLALPARSDQNVSMEGRLVESLDRISQALELRQMGRSILVGTYFDAPSRSYKPRKSFNPRLRVDRYLLTNLNAARIELEEVDTGFDRRAVHALLARIIFTCYLTDRGIIGESYFARFGVLGTSRLDQILDQEPEVAISHLFALFRALQEDFNGDLLEGDLSAEQAKIKPGHISILRRLLRGDDITTKQQALEFWAYDFSIIPIETISAIYESFLEADNPREKRAIGAYYTPRFLCEVVLDQAVGGFDTLLGKKYLDPACGSGIFLVGLFNRMAEELRRRNPDMDNLSRFAELRRIVAESLFGLDVNETACRIAAFSLYLAMLDQLDPKDIEQLPKPRLPKLVLMKSDETRDLEGLNIVCGDFFDPFSGTAIRDCDVVVGNPPWARQSKGSMAWWLKSRGEHVAQGQLAEGFVLKAPLHAKPSGRITFLLPSGVLFNHQKKAQAFQGRWLRAHAIETVLNLSDLRFYLFENATRPSVCVSYLREAPQPRHSIEYLVPKSTPEVLRAELLDVHELDATKIRLGVLVAAVEDGRPHRVWKLRMWAGARDRELLRRLGELPTLGDALRPLGKGGRGWVIGEGFQPLGENDDLAKAKQSVISRDDLFVQGRGEHLRLLLHEEDCEPATDFTGVPLRRMPKRIAIFEPPHVLVTKGLKSTYCSFRVFFRHAVRGVHGPSEDAEHLMVLAALLDSDVIQYYHFHTSANWAVERDEVHVEELGSTPFPMPDTSDEVTQGVFDAIVAEMRSAKAAVDAQPFGRSDQVAALRERLGPLIYEYLQVDEQEQLLIRDTMELWRPSAQPTRGSSVPTLKPVDADRRSIYVSRLCRTLCAYMRPDSWALESEVIVGSGVNMAVVVLRKASAPRVNGNMVERDSWDELNESLRRASIALSDHGSTLSKTRQLKFFEDDRIYIFKQLERRFWAESVALSDADEIAGAILFDKMVSD